MNAYHALETYTLQPPAWREPLTISTSAYPELYPGATALYPPAASSSTSTSTYAGQSRDAATADTGIVGLTKAKEDDLSETAVKTGLVTRPYVQSETFSAHQLIYPKFTHGHALPILSKLVSLVLEKRQSSPDITPQPGHWTYKPPSRVVYNDARREAWFNDLANPAIPLHKLSRNIPNNPASVTTAGTGTYGAARGSASSTPGTAIDKHLEMLVTRQIQIDRAVWFLRAIAGAEIAQALKSSRAVTSLPPAANYLTEFTSSVFEVVRRQLNEIVLPLTHHAGLGLSSRPGMSVKGRARNTLSEEQGRARFLARWKYLLALADRLARDRLLERTIWASKTLEWLATCHIAQLGWITDLVTDTCFNDIVHVGWMCRSLVDALVARRSDLHLALIQEAGQGETLLTEAVVAIKSLLRRVWLKERSAFISPQMHARPESIRILQEAALINGQDGLDWQDIIHRVEHLRCESGQADQRMDAARYTDIEDGNLHPAVTVVPAVEPGMCLEQASGAAHFLSILDSYTIHQSLAELCSQYLAPVPSPSLDRRASHTSAPTPSSYTKSPPTMSISLRLDLLLSWAVSNERFGDHRKYLALYVCKAFLDPDTETSAGTAEQLHPNKQYRLSLLQKSVVKLLDATEKTSQYDADAVVGLCRELVIHDALDVASLLQIVVTRGIKPIVTPSPTYNTHLRVLRELSAHTASESLRYQLSRLISVDASAEYVWTEALAEEKNRIRRQLSLLLGVSYDLDPHTARTAEQRPEASCRTLLTSSQKRELYSSWLVPIVIHNINDDLDTDVEYEDQLAILMKTLQAVWDYDGILQITYTVLAHSSNHVILDLITDVLQARMHIWHLTGAKEGIAEALWQAHRRLVAQKEMSIHLAGFALDVGQGAPHAPLRAEDLAADLATMRSENREHISESTPTFSDMDASHYEADGIGTSGDLVPSDRARQLLHLRAHDATRPQDSVADILSQLVEGDESRLPYLIELFLDIHRGLSTGLDGVLMSTLESPGDQSLLAMLHQPHDALPVVRFLQAIVLRGALDLPTLLQDAIAPALQSCLGLLGAENAKAVRLAERLVALIEPFWSWEDVVDADSLRLEGRFVGLLDDDEAIDSILSCVTHLFALVDALPFDNDALVKRCQTLCAELVAHEEFKVAMLRDLDRVTTLLLEGSIQPATAAMRTLSFIISSLKPKGIIHPSTENDTSVRNIGETGALAPTLYSSQLARIELQLYLKKLELQPEDSLSTQGTAFARHFVEKLLYENATAGTSLALDQLSAFGPSGIQQLLQACLDTMMQLLQTIPSALDQFSLTFSRLRQLSTIARHLIHQTQPNPATLQLMVDPSFALTWTHAVQAVAAGADESIFERVKILCDNCCLAMRFSDLWSNHQSFLRESMDVLLQLVKRDHEESGCETQRLHDLLDLVSYFLDSATPATRYEALVSFQQFYLTTDANCHFSRIFNWLTTLGPSPAFVIESASSANDRLALYKPWDYAEHTESPATAGREAATTNSGSIDLHRLSARVLSVLGRRDDTQDTESDRGRQSNFDSEISALQESVWRTDFRRSLTAQLEVPPPATVAPAGAAAADAASPSVYAPLTPAVAAAKVTEQAKSAKPGPVSKAGAEPIASNKKQTTKKRKIAPEVIIVEDESPKRKKTASKKKK